MDEGGPRPVVSTVRGMRTWLLRIAVVGIGVFALLQLVPYGWTHSNPPVVRDAPWPDARSEAIARESCYSCHSNETDWPAYAYVAPMSWLVRMDVDEAREKFNFSDWDESAHEADDAIEVIEDGEMPLGRYTMIHRSARLTDAEAQVLVDALSQMDDDD
jgi:hypothetical protein